MFEGSYEITPLFQNDVNALRQVSPLFLLALAMSTGYLILVRGLAGPSSGFFRFYLLVLGGVVLTPGARANPHPPTLYPVNPGGGGL